MSADYNYFGVDPSERLQQWAWIKLVVWARSQYQCSVCGDFIPASDATGHHIVNRCQGGSCSPENREIRCTWCEVEMHRRFLYGNFEYQWQIDEFQELIEYRNWHRTLVFTVSASGIEYAA